MQTIKVVDHGGRNSPSSPKVNGQKRIDLYESLKPLLIYGRLALIIPCGKSSYRSYKNWKLSLNLLPVTVSCLLMSWSALEMAVALRSHVEGRNYYSNIGILGYVLSLQFPAVFLFGLYVYYYFLKYSDKLYDIIIDRWNQSKDIMAEDKSLRLATVVAMLVVICSSLLVHVLFLTDLFHRLDGSDGFIESNNGISVALFGFYSTAMYEWTSIFSFSEFLVIFYLIMSYVLAFTQTIVPVMIIVFSRAISFQFRKIIETTAGTSASEAFTADLSDKDMSFWEDLVKRYEAVWLFLKAVNHFLSPLTFAYVTLSVFGICMQTFRALSGVDYGNVSTIMFTLTTLIAVFQLGLTIHFAGNVHSNAMQILDVLKSCPREHYDSAGVARLENQVSCLHIGFTGSYYYKITKSFLLSILNAVFTIEVVLLQSSLSPFHVNAAASSNSTNSAPNPQ